MGWSTRREAIYCKRRTGLRNIWRSGKMGVNGGSEEGGKVRKRMRVDG